MRYVISYDLNSPEQDYESLTTALKRSGAKRVLFSQWCGRWENATAAEIRDAFWQFMDSNDRILVTRVDGSGFAGRNLINRISEM